MDISDGIADNVASYDSVRIFDSGRLSEDEASENTKLVKELIETHKK